MNQSPPPRPDLPPPEDARPALAAGLPPAPGPGGPPRAAWRWWEAIAVYALGALVASVATLPVLRAVEPPSTARLAAAAASEVVVLGVVLLWLRVLHPGWVRVLGLPLRPWREVRAGALFGLGLYVVAALLGGGVLGILLRAVTGEPVRVPEQLPRDLSPLALGVAVPFALVVAPVVEELFFRGLLFRAVRDRRGFAAGAAASGLAFGLVHYVEAPWASAVLLVGVMVVTGAGLAYLYERRRNILAPVVAHAAFNLLGLALILAS